MIDREKVINGLECRLDINGSKYKHCLTCDYRHDIDHCQWACQTDGILEDALALLKAQEPRILTQKDMEDTEPGTVVWCEQRDEIRTYMAPMIKYDDGMFENRFLGASPEAADLTYTRFWSAKPSDQQREATPW